MESSEFLKSLYKNIKEIQDTLQILDSTVNTKTGALAEAQHVAL